MFNQGKTLIVYYSKQGNTKLIADIISEHFGFDKVLLEPIKPIKVKGLMKLFVGRRKAYFGEKEPLKPLGVSLDDYSNIIIGSPIWASRYAPVFNTFFEEHELKNKKVALYCSCSGDNGKFFEKISEQLTESEIVGLETFTEPANKNYDVVKKKAIEWIKSIID